MSKDDFVVKRPNISTCDRWRLLDEGDDIHFRRYHGKYSREGYVVGETNPLISVKDRTKPTPLRGC